MAKNRVKEPIIPKKESNLAQKIADWILNNAPGLFLSLINQDSIEAYEDPNLKYQKKK